MSKSIAQDMAYRQSLMKYAEKYGVSRDSRRYFQQALRCPFFENVQRHEDGQKKLAEKSKELRFNIKKQSSQAMTAERFISWGANTSNIRQRVFVSDTSTEIFK